MQTRNVPAQSGLYRPEFEHDACGIGALAHLKGVRSHQMIDDALSVLVNLEHRGGKGLEHNTGDGAGILFQVPHHFFRKEAQKYGHLLPDEGDYGVAMLFFPQDERGVEVSKRIFEEGCAKAGLPLLFWREVPIDPHDLGSTARACMPTILQAFVGRPEDVDRGEAFERRLYVCRRMVEKAVGKRLSEYLYERFFEPLGQGFPIWENCPQGHPIGGGGMFMTLSNMLKIGQVYLMDGKWKGQQLVDPAWIKEATAKQIETPNPGNDIWVCGYGYQFWRNPYEDSYRADGAYGQLTMVLPKKGLIVAIQCPESGDLNKVKPVMHELILSL